MAYAFFSNNLCDIEYEIVLRNSVLGDTNKKVWSQ